MQDKGFCRKVRWMNQWKGEKACWSLSPHINACQSRGTQQPAYPTDVSLPPTQGLQNGHPWMEAMPNSTDSILWRLIQLLPQLVPKLPAAGTIPNPQHGTISWQNQPLKAGDHIKALLPILMELTLLLWLWIWTACPRILVPAPTQGLNRRPESPARDLIQHCFRPRDQTLSKEGITVGTWSQDDLVLPQTLTTWIHLNDEMAHSRLG